MRERRKIMEQNDIKKAQIIPVNKMVICTHEKAKDSPIALPDGSEISSGFSVLVVEYVAKDCEVLRVGDIVFGAPLAKSLGTVDFLGHKYIMIRETDVGFAMRRGEKNGTTSN
jgi:hypothetical protein